VRGRENCYDWAALLTVAARPPAFYSCQLAMAGALVPFAPTKKN